MKFSKDNRLQLNTSNKIREKSVNEMEKAAKDLVDCFYEKDSSWGIEVYILLLIFPYKLYQISRARAGGVSLSVREWMAQMARQV